MVKIRRLHSWKVSPAQAAAIQRRLQTLVILRGSACGLRYVAGVDAASDPEAGWLYAAAVVMDLQDFSVRESAGVQWKTSFPYQPGYLSFREAPALLSALARLRIAPEAVICDGQGIAHPRGLGLASHLGVILDLPTVGCAKRRLVGEHRVPAFAAGSQTPLWFQGRVVGTVLRTRAGVKPVYVSPGHRMTVKEAGRLVLKACRGFRIPEPVRQAHLAAERLRREAERT